MTELQRALEQLKSRSEIERFMGALTLASYIVKNSEGWSFDHLEHLCQQAVEHIGDEIKGKGFLLVSWPAFWFRMGMLFGQRFRSPSELLEEAQKQAKRFLFVKVPWVMRRDDKE